MKKLYPIDERTKVAINGTMLDFRIRGTRPDNPVVLFLHGGPGMCDRHFVMRHQAPLADVCTLVCVDQRGAGRSYTDAQAKRNLDVDTVVEDARAMVEYLRERFHQEKIYIVGHSYGSFLGVLLCQRHPEHIAAYLGLGQLANGPENERLSYEFVLNEANRRGDKKAVAALTRIGAPKQGLYASLDDLMVQRNYMTKYGGETRGKPEPLLRSVILPILRSPEYTLADLLRYANGTFYNLRQLWQAIVTSDFLTTVRSLDVPVYITQGRYDINTPSELARAWFDALEAPHKQWVWFENSAHCPIREEAALWNDTLRLLFLKEK